MNDDSHIIKGEYVHFFPMYFPPPSFWNIIFDQEIALKPHSSRASNARVRIIIMMSNLINDVTGSIDDVTAFC